MQSILLAMYLAPKDTRLDVAPATDFTHLHIDRVTLLQLLFSSDNDTGAYRHVSETFSALPGHGQRVEILKCLGEGRWPGCRSGPGLRDVLDPKVAWFDDNLKSDTATTD